MGPKIDHNVRISIYCCMILVCSILSISEDYKIEKKNILNQWFVKLGWFWTNVFLIPLQFIDIGTEDKEKLFRVISKFILSSTLWYFSVNLFQFLDETISFDISGHTFLLIFSNLIINSELNFYNVKEDKKQKKLSSQNETIVSAIRTSLLILSVLWDFMLVQTTLFYHTLIQKVLGASWAIGSWYILHIIYYQEAQSRSTLLGRGDR